jgi:N-methylhydantoinase A
MARSALGTALMPGPLLVQEYDTTIVVPPGATACLDPHGNVLVALAPYGTAR